MATKIQLRRDTAANWANANPILSQGEPAFEIDTGREKIGDGVTEWNSLAYKVASSGALVSVNQPFTATKKFDKIYYSNRYVMTGNLVYSLDTTDEAEGGGSLDLVVGNGGTIDLSSLTIIESDLNDTSGVVTTVDGNIYKIITLKVGSEKRVHLSDTGKTDSAPDTTPPTFSNVSVDNLSDTTADFNAQINEAGTIFWAAFPTATAQQTNTVIEAGTGAVDSGSVATSGSTIETDNVTGLTASTDYKIHYFGRDSAGNESDPAITSEFSTTSGDVAAPTVTSFTIENADPDLANIVFSETVVFPDVTGLSLNGDFSDITLSNPTGSGANWSVDLSRAAVNGESGSFVYGATNTIEDTATPPNGLVAGSTVVRNNVAETGDTTPPTFSAGPASANVSDTSFDITATLNENGTVYAVVVADGASAPSSTEVKAGTGSGGSGQLATDSAADSGSGVTLNLTGLSASTAYDVYVVAEDDEGTPNLQASPTLVNVTTISGDVTKPVASFNPTDSATGVAIDSNIVITFNEAILNTNGTEVTDGNVASLITLKEDNISGPDIAFSATINVGKTEITINPTSDLPNSQAVFVQVNNFEDAAGNEETSGQSATFTTAALSTVTFVSAEILDANPDQLRIACDSVPSASDVDGFTLEETGYNSQTRNPVISSVNSVVGNVLILDLATRIYSLNTFTITNNGTNNNINSFTDEVVDVTDVIYLLASDLSGDDTFNFSNPSAPSGYTKSYATGSLVVSQNGASGDFAPFRRNAVTSYLGDFAFIIKIKCEYDTDQLQAPHRLMTVYMTSGANNLSVEVRGDPDYPQTKLTFGESENGGSISFTDQSQPIQTGVTLKIEKAGNAIRTYIYDSGWSSVRPSAHSLDFTSIDSLDFRLGYYGDQTSTAYTVTAEEFHIVKGTIETELPT
jgi:hypothetical protein